MITIHSAEFVCGAMERGQFPKDPLPQIAFAGRSNVGKSSLINFLLNRRNLVKVGKTPGKTRQVNFFLINESFYFVDLPGFGYANVAKSEKEQWGSMLDAYFEKNDNLKGVVHLVDSRHPDQDTDRMMADYLDALDLRGLVVATKVDKFKKSQLAKAENQVKALYGAGVVMTSAEKKIGKDAIWKVLGSWL